MPTHKFQPPGERAGSTRKAGRPLKDFGKPDMVETLPGLFERAMVKLKEAGITNADRIAVVWNPSDPSTSTSLAMAVELAGKTSFGQNSTTGIRSNNIAFIELELKRLTSTVIVNAGPQTEAEKESNTQLVNFARSHGIRYLIADELLEIKREKGT